MAEEGAICLLLIPEGEEAVRCFFSRPEKLVVPILEAIMRLPGGFQAVASLISFMSPVQAFR